MDCERRAETGRSSARYAASATMYGCGASADTDGARAISAMSGVGRGFSGLTAISRCATFVYTSSTSKRPRRLWRTPASCRYHRDLSRKGKGRLVQRTLNVRRPGSSYAGVLTSYRPRALD